MGQALWPRFAQVGQHQPCHLCHLCCSTTTTNNGCVISIAVPAASFHTVVHSKEHCPIHSFPCVLPWACKTSYLFIIPIYILHTMSGLGNELYYGNSNVVCGYSIGEPLGEGAFCSVFKGTHMVTGMQVRVDSPMHTIRE